MEPASGICFDRVLPKRVPCNPKSYLEQLGHWTVSLNLSENTSIFLPVGSSTEDSLGTKTSLIGEPGEGLEELASFWMVVETTFLPLDQTFEAKGKSPVTTPLVTTARQGVLTKGSFA